MSHGLILAHLKNTRYLHGGAVYRESIRDLLVASEPGLEVEEIFVHDQQHPYRRLARQVFDLLTAPFSRYPAKVKHFCTRDFKRRVAALCAARDYRLFVINGADMLWTLDLLPAGAEALYIAHNIEHRLYRQQVEKYQNIPGLRALLAADAAKFEAFELAALRRLSRIVCISRPDADILQGYCQPGVRIATIMPSFAYPPAVRRRRVAEGALKLGFLGNLEWWPNRRGLDWFLNEVWPHLAANRELHLYGQGSRARQDGRRIFGHGFVADLASVWAEIELMIQPITCGGGDQHQGGGVAPQPDAHPGHPPRPARPGPGARSGHRGLGGGQGLDRLLKQSRPRGPGDACAPGGECPAFQPGRQPGGAYGPAVPRSP